PGHPPSHLRLGEQQGLRHSGPPRRARGLRLHVPSPQELRAGGAAGTDRAGIGGEGGRGGTERPCRLRPPVAACCRPFESRSELRQGPGIQNVRRDRKSTRLNSSHVSISYAVFCLKKKKHKNNE